MWILFLQAEPSKAKQVTATILGVSFEKVKVLVCIEDDPRDTFKCNETVLQTSLKTSNEDDLLGLLPLNDVTITICDGDILDIQI